MADPTTQSGPCWLCDSEAIECSRRRWAALIRYLDNGDRSIDNNHLENRIRPVALGRSNWLFTASLRAGQRAASIMSLIQSASSMVSIPTAISNASLSDYPPNPPVSSRSCCLIAGSRRCPSEENVLDEEIVLHCPHGATLRLRPWSKTSCSKVFCLSGWWAQSGLV
jgi:hypothetical protein